MLKKDHYYHFFRKTTSIITAACFILTSAWLPSVSRAQEPLQLPPIGTLLTTSPNFTPANILGLSFHPEDPLKLDFIINTGDSNLTGEDLRTESQRLVHYFMATLTVPDDQLWVNLSPYEKNKIMADGLGQTELGRDLLAQDYILKQLTASFMYPESEAGKKFWDKIYALTKERLGNANIPTETYNKIWIIPQRAKVYVHDNNVFVSDAYLKVMLEEDYLALNYHSGEIPDPKNSTMGEAANIVREVLLPEIEREVNKGTHFAPLRQIYQAMILATWYKKNLHKSFLGEQYINQNKIQGIELNDITIKEKIYNQYLASFKTGVYDYIREDYDPATQEVLERKYFSGGIDQAQLGKKVEEDTTIAAPTIGTNYIVPVTNSVNGRPTSDGFTLKNIGTGMATFLLLTNLCLAGCSPTSALTQLPGGSAFMLGSIGKFNIDTTALRQALINANANNPTSITALKTIPKGMEEYTVPSSDVAFLGDVRHIINTPTEKSLTPEERNALSELENKNFATVLAAIPYVIYTDESIIPGARPQGWGNAAQFYIQLFNDRRYAAWLQQSIIGKLMVQEGLLSYPEKTNIEFFWTAGNKPYEYQADFAPYTIISHGKLVWRPVGSHQNGTKYNHGGSAWKI